MTGNLTPNHAMAIELIIAASPLTAPEALGQPRVLPPLPTQRAPGITYQTQSQLPGMAFFDCSRLHATLSTSACAQMWEAANKGRSERFSTCRACFVGASHAGVSNASRSPIRGTLVCGRCTRGATRLINGHCCVSCYNREREVIRGKNARGAFPTKLAPLTARSIFYRSNGRTHTVRRERSASSNEMIISTLRDSIHDVTFGWRGSRAGLGQQRLF